MPVRRINTARHRWSPGITRGQGGNITVNAFTSVNNGSVTTSTIPVLGANQGVAKVCNDVVSSNFRTRVSGGEVINNPFSSIVSEASYGGSGPSVLYTGPWSPNATRDFSCDHLNTQNVLDYKITPWASDMSDYQAFLPPQIEGLRRTANTSALANVDTSTATALASLGELNATFSMLGNPLGNIVDYLRRFKWRDRKLVNVPTARQEIEALTNQYLVWYYGLKPFLSDVENILAAYIKSAHQAERQTARGSAADETETVNEFYSGSWPAQNDGQTWYKHRKVERLTMSVRSGILYEPSQLSYGKLFGYRWSDVPSALWELTPWSFAIDYFSNLGKLIEALSPRIGVNYLAAWDTVRVTRAVRVETIASGVWGSKFTQIRASTEWAECTDKLCVRSPKSPYTGVGLTVGLGHWESKTKVLAVLSLITQQLLNLPGAKPGRW